MPSCLFVRVTRINEPIRLLDWRKGSHSPLGDRQARLTDGESANHEAKRSYPSARPNFPQPPCNLFDFMI